MGVASPIGSGERKYAVLGRAGNGEHVEYVPVRVSCQSFSRPIGNAVVSMNLLSGEGIFFVAVTCAVTGAKPLRKRAGFTFGVGLPGPVFWQ